MNRDLIELNSGMLFDEVFKDAKWRGKDEFPSNFQWKNEINRWLIYVKSKGQLNRFKPRLNSARTTERDETLAEISSAYLMEIHLNYPIVKWEEKTVNGRNVEFVVKYSSKDKIYCEVKSPGWESTLSFHEKLSIRKRMPKYLHAESRTYSLIEPIRRTVEKAYPKFDKNNKNLLIINDDFFISPFESEDDIEIALYDDRHGCFSDENFSNLGGILFVNYFQINEIEFKCKFFKNNYAKSKFYIKC